jgi:hypothetical protein
MRGLPDSAVYGTYRRLTRKPKPKSYKAEVRAVFAIIDALNRFNAKHSKINK